VRLSPQTVHTITTTARAIYGPEVQVYLFGSRTNNNAKGGDIDLLITHTDPARLTYENKITFLARLKMAIGDQKIDLLYSNHPDTNDQNPMLKHIMQHGNPVVLTS
jgi:predicted nucleotidyltransferase